MAINRMYRPAEQVIMDDWFEPNLDLLNAGLQAAQTQQDEAKALLAKIGETQFEHLKGDVTKAEQVYGDIFDRTSQLAEGAMGDGDLRGVRADIDRYQREVKRRFRPEGDIGKMVANKARFDAWNKEIGEMAKKEIGKGGITAQHAQALRAKVLKDYETAGGIGEYDPTTGYKDIGLIDPTAAIDENTLVETYGKGYIADSIDGAGIDPKTGQPANGAMWRDKGKIWRKTSMGIKEVKENDVFTDLLSAITNHEGYTQYQNQLNQLGLSRYAAGDMALKDENGELILDANGKATLDKNHPIVAAAMRGASKFGFRQVKYDDDIKFDPYDLEYYKSGLRMKEERLKGQMMTFNSTARQRNLDPAEISKNMDNLKQTISDRQKVVDKLKEEIKNAPDQATASRLQSELNAEINQLTLQKHQFKNGRSKLRKLGKQGGMDMDVEVRNLKERLKAYLLEQQKNNPFATGDINVPSDATIESWINGTGVPPQYSMQVGEDAAVRSPINDIINQTINSYATAIKKGTEKGYTEQTNVIIPTEGTMLAQKMKHIQTAIANGQVSFASDDGVSFNQNEFSTLVAEGKVSVAPMAGLVNGRPGFQITIKDDKLKGGMKTIQGNVLGLENSTYFDDLAVDFEDRSQVAGISKAKAANLRKQSDLYSGLAIQVPGYGSVGNQMTMIDAYLYDVGDRIDTPVMLPDGIQMKLTKGHGGTFFPTFYNNDGTPIDRTTLEKNGLPKGSMSESDIISYLGSNDAWKSSRNKPVKKGGTVVQQSASSIGAQGTF